MSTPLISAEGLEFEAGGRRILGPVSLEVEAGERLLVVGPNGAGKTTLLRLLAGVAAPSAGQVRLLDRPLAALSRIQRARRIAWLPQVLPDRTPFSVAELVLLGRYPHLSPWQLGPGAADRRAVRRALARVEAEAFLERSVDTLSGGERQLVYLAAALAQEASLLVLDEPTAHLDPHFQSRIVELVSRWCADGGTVVMATHDLSLAGAMADRMLLLSNGEIAARGRPGRVLSAERLAAIYQAGFRVESVGGRPRPLLEL